MFNYPIKLAALFLGLACIGTGTPSLAQEQEGRRFARLAFTQTGRAYEAFVVGKAVLFVDAQLKDLEAAAHADGRETAPVPPLDYRGYYTSAPYHVLRRQLPGLMRRLDLAAIFGGATLAHSHRAEVIETLSPSLSQLETNASGVTLVLSNRSADQFTLQLDANFLPVSAKVNGANFPIFTTGEVPGFPDAEGGVEWVVLNSTDVEGFDGTKPAYRLSGRFALSPSKSFSDAVYHFFKLVDAETGLAFTFRSPLRCLVRLKGGFLSFGGGKEEDTFVFQSSSERIALADHPLTAITASGRMIQDQVKRGVAPFSQTVMRLAVLYAQLKPRSHPYVIGLKNPATPYTFSADGTAVWIVFQALTSGEELSIEADLNGPTGRATFEGKSIKLLATPVTSQAD